MYEDVLLNQNIHWEGGHYPTGIEREKKADVEEFLDTKYIQIIAGPRRAGKTYVLYQLMESLLKVVEYENVLYANLDDPSYTPLKIAGNHLGDVYDDYIKLKNPEGRVYLFLDEVQSIPEWERWVKSVYDSEKDVKFILTGSNASLLSSELSTLLSGREVNFEVYPFDFFEFLRARDVEVIREDEVDKTYQSNYSKKGSLRHHINEILKYGSFPEPIFLEDRLKEIILERYYEAMIYRDVIPRVRNPEEIEELAYYLATNISNLFSYNSAAQDMDISPTSVKKYMNYFEQAYLFFTVPKFSFSVKKQLKNPKKVYCVDPGLRNIAGFKFSRDAGRLAENLVFLDLIRRGKKVYYYKEKKEVDFVVKSKEGIEQLIQSSWDMREEKTREREITGLIEAMEYFGLEEGVITTDDHFAKEEIDGKKIHFVPLWTWLLRP